MRISTGVFIAQWALLAGLGALLVVMYRQLGRAFHRSQAGRELGPPTGVAAAPFRYQRVSDGTIHRVTPGHGTATLVAFVDPTCPSCEQLVDALSRADRSGDLHDVDVVLLMSDPPIYIQISEVFQRTRFDIGQILDQETIDFYRATATPLLVGIDRDGVVRAADSAVSAAQVKAFCTACLQPDSSVTSVDTSAPALAGARAFEIHHIGSDDTARSS